MIKIINLYKKFQYPINEFQVLKKLFFNNKENCELSNNQFYGLQNINLEFAENDKIFVLGKSGAGKTTLYSILSNIIDYDYGEKKSSNSIFSSSFRPLPQNLLPRMSLEKLVNFLISFHIKNLNFDIYKNLKSDILNYLNISNRDSKKYWYEFPQEYQYLIILKLAIFSNEKIYLFDNFFFLNNDQKLNLAEKFFNKKKNKTIIVFDCFNLELIKKYAKKILILNNGKVKDIVEINKINDMSLENLIKLNKSEAEYLDIDVNE